MNKLIELKFGNSIDYRVGCTIETLENAWNLVKKLWIGNLVVIEIIYPDMSKYVTPDIFAFPGGEYYSFEVNLAKYRHYIYSPLAQEKLPQVIRSGYKTPPGASIVITFDHNGSPCALLVKDRTKPFATNVAGMANLDEDNVATAVREIHEETGIVVTGDQLATRGEFSFTHTNQVLGATLSSGTIIYHIHLNVEQTALVVKMFDDTSSLMAINIIDILDNNEIEKIILINPSVLSIEEPILYDNVKISAHHAEMISRVFSARGCKDVMTGRKLGRLTSFEMNIV